MKRLKRLSPIDVGWIIVAATLGLLLLRFVLWASEVFLRGWF